jgi:hypothetical protein
MLTTYVCLLVKSTGKPDAGNPHVRFDEGEGGCLPPYSTGSAVQNTAPFMVKIKPSFLRVVIDIKNGSDIYGSVTIGRK